MAKYKKFFRLSPDFHTGQVAILPICLSAIPFALVLGALSAKKGWQIWELAAMSGIIFAGASQFILIEQWTAERSVIVLWGIVFLVNARHILMGAAIAPAMASQMNMRQSLIALFFLTDEIWAVSLKRAKSFSLSFAFMIGCGITLYLTWLMMTMLGHRIGQLISDPSRWGLDFAFPLIFIMLLGSFYKGKTDIVPWAIAAITAKLVYHLFPGPWYIMLGCITGCSYVVLAHKLSAKFGGASDD